MEQAAKDFMEDRISLKDYIKLSTMPNENERKNYLNKILKK